MSDSAFGEHFSRRSFLNWGGAAVSALFLQGCASLRAGNESSADGFLTERLPDSNHPLTRLSFSSESRIDSSMTFRRLLTPGHTMEGIEAWHMKGDHPYSFATNNLFASDAASIPLAFDEIDDLEAPPLGIRSAVPLGGFGTGTIELRADGRLADWQIFNNSPAGGGGNVHLDDAFFGLRIRPHEGSPRAWALRTHPPEKLPPVERLLYSGAFPVSRLRLSDPALPLNVSLYAYNDFQLHNAANAATPAIVFSLILSNPTSEALETSFMFNLPNHIEGTYRTERGFILSRSGEESFSGEISLSFDASLDFSTAVSSDLEEIWEAFQQRGHFDDMASLGIFEHGAVSTQFVIEPGATRTVSMILAWHFPHRPFAGAIVGNAYTNRFRSASEAATQINRKLPQIWRSLLSWDVLCTENTLPRPVHRALRNSLAQLYKTTFCTAGGRWRSWDSYATPNLCSLSEQLFRAVPLMLLYPEALQSQLRAFATRQHPDGQFTQALGSGDRFPLDYAAPSSSAATIPSFILLTYYYFRSSGDEAFLKELWPHIEKALPWQLALANPEGLPSNLPALSDWMSYDEEGIDLSDALLHLGALSAVRSMAIRLELQETIKELGPIIASGRQSIERYFWTETHFRARWTAYKPSPDAADDTSLYSLAWLHLLGFGSLLDATKLQQHLDTIQNRNSPQIEPASSSNRTHRWRPAATLAWAALKILTGSSSQGLKAAGEMIEFLEEELRDPWGFYKEIDGNSSLPWSEPHHVSHLAIWIVFAALSGQQYNASDRKLAFSPTSGAKISIPFFTPEAHGLLTARRSGQYQIQVISGRLELKELTIGENIRYRDVFLETGQSMMLG